MHDTSPAILTAVVAQYIDGAADLRAKRSTLLRAPQVDLFLLARHDERIAAHIDGLTVAVDAGYRISQAALEQPGVGTKFVLTVTALERGDRAQIGRLLAQTDAVPNAEQEIASAFGWVSAELLRGITPPLLASDDPRQRWLAIAACAAHGVDPGSALDHGIVDADERLRARSLKAAGQLGRTDLVNACLAHIADSEQACRSAAAWSAALLGDRGETIDKLRQLSMQRGLQQDCALRLILKILDMEQAHALLKSLAKHHANQRTLVQGVGIAGDPHYVPWLIQQMEDEKLTRLAGESFSMITGLDLAYLDLDRKPPEYFQGGPNDDPENPEVAMDPDDGLPWPDAEKIRAWWQSNQSRFVTGRRYFMGEPVARDHCIRVLKEAFQRQRIAAAEYLCLLQPGTPLFNTAAPAWRQERWLAKLQ